MFLTWAIVYLDRTDEQRCSRERQFQDRHLYLDTSTLDSATRAAIELLIESGKSSTERSILKFRNLFKGLREEELKVAIANASEFRTVSLDNYTEDETGKELSNAEVGELLTGSPTAILLPPGARPHDIDYMLALPTAIPVAQAQLSKDEIRLLGYFSRDLKELTESAFWKDGPGTLEFAAKDPKLKTAVTDDELRSFVTIFRRLYMETEQANFLKAVKVFERAVGNHRTGNWVVAEAASYTDYLQRPPWFPPAAPSGGFTFSSKRLIDVFIYTQYAHQPKPNRERQFNECLAEIGGKKPVLIWLFLRALQAASFMYRNAGKSIVLWFNCYCEHHQVSPAILASILDDNPGIGAQEKEADRKARLLREKAEQLAAEIWKEKGSPGGGPVQFLDQAREELNKALGA